MADAAGGWLDVSVPLRDGMLHWPGDSEVQVVKTATHQAGDGHEVTRLAMSAHTGTHLDAPLHFVADREPIGAFPLELGIGPARVVQLDPASGPAGLDQLDVEQLAGVERLLLKTSNSSRRGYDQPFAEDYVHLTSAAAEAVVRAGVRLLGIDYLSIGSPGEDGNKAHRALLGSGVWIVEGLRLRDVPPGWYDVVCLPLAIPEADGAPVRVVLRESRA
jgi:arylformamidase